MPYNPDLADRVRQALSSFDVLPGETLEEKKMFGGLCFTLNGKMLVGVDRDRVVVRLSDENYAREFQEGRVLPMDLTGRPLRNFAYLSAGTFEDEHALLDWVAQSAEFVREHMMQKPTKLRKRR